VRTRPATHLATHPPRWSPSSLALTPVFPSKPLSCGHSFHAPANKVVGLLLLEPCFFSLGHLVGGGATSTAAADSWCRGPSLPLPPHLCATSGAQQPARVHKVSQNMCKDTATTTRGGTASCNVSSVPSFPFLDQRRACACVYPHIRQCLVVFCYVCARGSRFFPGLLRLCECVGGHPSIWGLVVTWLCVKLWVVRIMCAGCLFCAVLSCVCVCVLGVRF